MNYLNIYASFQLEDTNKMSLKPVIIPQKRMEVKIVFELVNQFNQAYRRTTIIMTARTDNHRTDRLREELLQSAYAEYEIVTSTLCGPDDSGEWKIEIIDPQEILKWFGVDLAADLFKKHQKHDKPLRLPASLTIGQ